MTLRSVGEGLDGPLRDLPPGSIAPAEPALERRSTRDDLARIERIAQAIPDVVDGQHGEEDGDAREERPVRRMVEVVLGVEEDAPPRGDVGWEPEAEEG